MTDDPTLTGALPADVPHLARVIVAWVEQALTPNGFSDSTVVLGLVDFGIRVAYERRPFPARHHERLRAKGLDPATLPTTDEIELSYSSRTSTIALWSWTDMLDALRSRGNGFLVVRPGLAPDDEIRVPEEENTDGERLASYVVVGEVPDNSPMPYIVDDESSPLRMVVEDEAILCALLRLVMDDDPGKTKLGSFARWCERMEALQALASQ